MKEFGMAKGTKVGLYEIKGKKGVKALITDFGATAVSLFVPDKDGNPVDVICGYDSAEEYEKGDCYFGATIGRAANRIADAKVTINGKEYQLEVNDNENCLHSGSNGLSERIWTVKEEKENSITFAITDQALSDGFPGNLSMEVTYTITDDNAFSIHYSGVSDQDTICNFTNHSYFNLNGHQNGTVLNHKLQLNADAYTPVKSSHAIPTGELAPVEGTPFDFREEKTVGRDLDLSVEQMGFVKGYDHNYVIDQTKAYVARVTADLSGIAMEVTTDQPGIQLYTGNFIGGQKGKGGVIYADRDALCLESQHFPNSANDANFKRPLLKAGEKYDTTTAYRFYLA